MAVTLLSPTFTPNNVSDYDIAVTGFPSFIPDRPSLSVLPVCVYRAIDGRLKRPCRNDATVPGNVNNSIVSVFPELVDVGDRRRVLMPASAIAPDFSSSAPAVVMFDTLLGMYDPQFGVVVLNGEGGGNRHPESNDLYGAVSVNDGRACFLTSKRGQRFGRFQQLARYDLFVHCFDHMFFTRNGGIVGLDRQSILNMRVRKLGTTASYRSPRFARIAAANGHVYVAYEQTRMRTRGVISEIYVHKLANFALSPRPLISSSSSSRQGQAVPLVIEMPVITAGSTAAEGGATSAAQLMYVPRTGGVAVRVWSALNITGEYTMRGNRMLMKGTAEYVFERPQQWLIMVDGAGGGRRRPRVVPVPVKSRGNGASSDVIPEEYGAMVMGGSAVSKSGGKLVVYGMLKRDGGRFGSGPLFTYDLDLPQKARRTMA